MFGEIELISPLEFHNKRISSEAMGAKPKPLIYHPFARTVKKMLMWHLECNKLIYTAAKTFYDCAAIIEYSNSSIFKGRRKYTKLLQSFRN